MCLLKVYTEGRLIVEFNFDDLLRIRSWHFAIRNHRELIPRSVIAMQVTMIYVKVVMVVMAVTGLMVVMTVVILLVMERDMVVIPKWW